MPEQRLAERGARQIESALATASLVPENVTMVPGAGLQGSPAGRADQSRDQPVTGGALQGRD